MGGGVAGIYIGEEKLCGGRNQLQMNFSIVLRLAA